MGGTFAHFLYWMAMQVLRLIDVLERMFDLFAGGATVSFDGRSDYLTNLFFTNDTVTIAYGVMAAAGIALSVGFALAALARKVLDPGGRGQVSVARILGSLVKSIGLIIITNSVITVTFNATNMLLSYVHYNAEISSQKTDEIVFTDEMRGAMARALNTLGNYSLNDSYSEKYNINLCFNDMRSDLLYLSEQGVFDYEYLPQENGDSWQSVLASVARTADLSTDLYPGREYPEVTSAILSAMETVRTNKTLPALSSYRPSNLLYSTRLSIDTTVFLMATMDAAWNEKMNEHPGVSDALRGPFFTEQKSIYDEKEVAGAFDISRINWLILFLACAEVIFSLTVMLFNCITRIFSMIFLYIISPGIFATMPFDDGSRTREWINMFLVQCLGVFATVIPMKLIMVFVPIILDVRLSVFENGFFGQMAKLLLILGAFAAARRASTMLAGLITNQNRGTVIGASEMKVLGKTLGKQMAKTFEKRMDRA